MTENPKPFQVLYDFTDVPTIKRFALDNTRIRCLMGPFGPLSNDTEYLGRYGWRRIDEYGGEEIVQCTELGEASFVVPDHYIVQPCEEFIHFKTTSLDMMLSEEHRVLIKDRYGKMRIRFAHDMYEYFHKGSPWTNDLIPISFSLKNNTNIPLTDDELRLMVAVVADGSFHKKVLSEETYNTNGCCMGFVKERKKDRLRKLLSTLNIPYKESPSKRITYFYFCSPIKKKVFDDFFWDASYEQKKVICDEVRFWDGNQRSDNIVEFYSTVKDNADFIQYCFASTGYGTSVQTRKPNNDGSFGKKDKYTVRAFESTFVGFPRKKEAIQYEKFGNGFKYCFSTDAGFFVARRNGRIFITGNSGKSSGCVMEDIRRAHEQRPGPDGIRRTRSVVVRNTFGQLKDTTIKTFCDWFPPKVFGEFRVTDHSYLFTKFPGIHHEVIFRALDRPDQVSNLLSLEVTWAWFNEVREIPWSIVEAMDSRIGRYPSKRDGGASWLGMFMDTNPCDEGSTLYNIAEKIKPDNFKMFKQPSGLSAHAENVKHLPKNYYQNLAKGKSEMYVRIYIHGQYGYLISGRPVFMSFKDNIHVASRALEPIKGLPLITGWDFGLSPGVTIGQITPLGQLRILDEVVADGVLFKPFLENSLIPLLRQKYFGMNVVGFGDMTGTNRNPTSEQTSFDILHSPEIGLNNIEPARTNDMVSRLGAVETFLNKMVQGEPGLLISPNCHYLRKAMNGGYHYEKEAKSMGSEYKPTPEKNFSSHIADSLQYLCMYIVDMAEKNKRWRQFAAQIKKRDYKPASSVAGY